MVQRLGVPSLAHVGARRLSPDLFFQLLAGPPRGAGRVSYRTSDDQGRARAVLGARRLVDVVVASGYVPQHKIIVPVRDRGAKPSERPRDGRRRLGNCG